MQVYFKSGWGELGLIYNYIDNENYNIVQLSWDRDSYKYLKGWQIQDGLLVENWAQYYPTSSGSFNLRVDVDNLLGTQLVYVDDVLQIER